MDDFFENMFDPDDFDDDDMPELPADELYDPDDPEGTWQLVESMQDRLTLLEVGLSELRLLEPPDTLSDAHDDWEEQLELLLGRIEELKALLGEMM